MKRVALLVCLFAGLLMMSQNAKAQFRQGDMLLNGGLSVGLIGYSYGAYSGGFPALTASLEYSLDDRFAVGPYVGFFSRSYNQTAWNPVTQQNYRYRSSLSVFAFGGRGTFHATSSLNEWFNWSIDERKLDIYGSALLGFEVYSWSDNDENAINNHSAGRLILGPVIGGRYFFNDQFSAYFETGRGAFGAATLGVSLRLN